MIKEKVLERIEKELSKRYKQYGYQNHGDCLWLAIMTEEAGEVAKEVLEIIVSEDPLTKKRLQKELVQVVVAAVAWLECLEREVN